MSVTATVVRSMATVEVLADGSLSATAKSITHNAFDESNALTSSTSVPITKCAFFLAALTAGADTIDLTAVPSTNGAVIDGTGLKVQAIHLKNLGANTMTFTFGASNPYNLSGADWVLNLAPGQDVLYFGADAAPDISALACEIDVAGTGTQTYECSILMG